MQEMGEQINKSEGQLRQERAQKVLNFLDQIGVYEYIQKLKSSPEEVSNLSFDDYKNFLIRINGVARDIPVKNRGFDGDTVMLKGVFEEAFPPREEDKEELLEYSYNKIGKTKNAGDEAYMLPAVINAVHVFSDGNGRTSRIINVLLSSSSKEEFAKRLELALGEYGRDESLDINPGLITYDLEDLVLEKHGWEFRDSHGSKAKLKIDMVNDIVTLDDHDENYQYNNEKIVASENEAHKLKELHKKNQEYVVTAIYEILKEKGFLNEVLLNQGGGYVVKDRLSVRKMQSILEKEDWENIFSRFYELEKEQVKLLVDMFVEPDKVTLIGTNKSLRDLFIERINTVYKKNNSN